MKFWGAAVTGLPVRWQHGSWVEVGGQEGRETGNLKRPVQRQGRQQRARGMTVAAEARAGIGVLGGAAEKDSAATWVGGEEGLQLVPRF